MKTEYSCIDCLKVSEVYEDFSQIQLSHSDEEVICYRGICKECMDKHDEEETIEKLKAERDLLLNGLKIIANKETAFIMSDGMSDKYNNYEQGWEGVADYAAYVINCHRKIKGQL